MAFLKELKWNVILTSLLYVIMGVILLFFPETTAKSICYIIAWILIIMGAFSMLVYLFRDMEVNYYRNDFISGLIQIVIGCFIIYKVDIVISLVPFVLGLFVIISGVRKFQDAIDMKKMGYNDWLYIIIIAVINIVFGVVLLLNPFTAAKVMFMVIGAGLIFSGITDIVSTLYLSKKIKEHVADMKALEQ